MGVIKVKKLGLAVGLTCAILHLGCALVVAITSREQAILFFNTLLHGLDVSSILRTQISTAEMVYGVIQIFVLGWLVGATIASIYNFNFIKNTNTQDTSQGGCCGRP